MPGVRYLTDPQVHIDPTVTVHEWHLNQEGRRRVAALVARNPFAGTVAVVSSSECKAIETAAPVAAALSLVPDIVHDTHENDRSSTGFLPDEVFEAMADRFFAHPDDSAQGWERAIDAQIRILAATELVLDRAPEGDILIVGHGGVGTQLWCALSTLLISRTQDHPGSGGGNCFAFDRESHTPVCGWTPMEML